MTPRPVQWLSYTLMLGLHSHFIKIMMVSIILKWPLPDIKTFLNVIVVLLSDRLWSSQVQRNQDVICMLFPTWFNASDVVATWNLWGNHITWMLHISPGSYQYDVIRIFTLLPIAVCAINSHSFCIMLFFSWPIQIERPWSRSKVHGQDIELKMLTISNFVMTLYFISRSCFKKASIAFFVVEDPITCSFVIMYYPMAMHQLSEMHQTVLQEIVTHLSGL